MPKSILIVDDLEHLRTAIRSFLEGASGFYVCGEAVDGVDALQKAQELKPNLIILDASMPRMTGFEAAPKLKKILLETPIILFTLHESLMKGFEPREIGVDAVVAKDRGLKPLRDCIQKML